MTTAANPSSQSMSLSDASAQTLANSTKTVPQMAGITPRWLTHLLSWVPVEAGIYRGNKVVHPESVMADRGLRVVQRLGRRGDRTLLGDGDQHTETTEIDHGRLTGASLSSVPQSEASDRKSD